MIHTPHTDIPALPVAAFTPVPVKPRRDGWTPERQAGFIKALATCGCVGDAAARVGMSSDGAYDLRLREGSASFREAWDGALCHAVRRLSEAAYSRALYGVARPIFYKGEQVGEHRVFNEGFTRFLLRHLDSARYAPDPTVKYHNLDETKAVAVADGVRNVLADPADDLTGDAVDEVFEAARAQQALDHVAALPIALPSAPVRETGAEAVERVGRDNAARLAVAQAQADTDAAAEWMLAADARWDDEQAVILAGDVSPVSQVLARWPDHAGAASLADGSPVSPVFARPDEAVWTPDADSSTLYAPPHALAAIS